MPDQSVLHTEYEWAEPYVEDVSLEEVKISIFGLKNWKAPGTGGISAELKIRKWRTACRNLQIVTANIGRERISDSWNDTTITQKSIQNKMWQLLRDISLNSKYKVFARVLLNRIVSSRRIA